MARKKKVTASESTENSFVRFGLEPEESTHYFLVNIPNARSPHIYISEHFEFYETKERMRIEYEIPAEHEAMRCILPREKWKKISDSLQFEFNTRLKRAGLKSSRFVNGYNIVPRLFGKEIVLLCWAIEDADPALIPAAIKNWQGLKPEERWWLYTMTAAASGHAVKHRNTGWRKAVRFALTENPTGD